jgi:predicted MFS family arabinose efflux permease
VWNFSLNVAGPFFNVYVIQGLNGDAGSVGLLSVVSALSGLPGQRLFGILADRWGPRRVQLLTGLIIPLLPVAWVFVRSPWHVIPINIVAGFVWAGYTLASFNLLLTIVPEDQRPRYTALYQIVVLASLAAGAAVGGIVITGWGYAAVFVLSGAGRFIAALLFARFVRQPIA